MAKQPVPVTNIRFRVPKGTDIAKVINNLKVSFDNTAPGRGGGVSINTDICCVDVSVVSPVSTIGNPINPAGKVRTAGKIRTKNPR